RVKTAGTAEETVTLGVQFQDALGRRKGPRRVRRSVGLPMGDGRPMVLLVMGGRVRAVAATILARRASVPRIATAVVSHIVGRRTGAEGKKPATFKRAGGTRTD